MKCRGKRIGCWDDRIRNALVRKVVGFIASEEDNIAYVSAISHKHRKILQSCSWNKFHCTLLDNTTVMLCEIQVEMENKITLQRWNVDDGMAGEVLQLSQ